MRHHAARQRQPQAREFRVDRDPDRLKGAGRRVRAAAAPPRENGAVDRDRVSKEGGAKRSKRLDDPPTTATWISDRTQFTEGERSVVALHAVAVAGPHAARALVIGQGRCIV